MQSYKSMKVNCPKNIQGSTLIMNLIFHDICNTVLQINFCDLFITSTVARTYIHVHPCIFSSYVLHFGINNYLIFHFKNNVTSKIQIFKIVTFFPRLIMAHLIYTVTFFLNILWLFFLWPFSVYLLRWYMPK